MKRGQKIVFSDNEQQIFCLLCMFTKGNFMLQWHIAFATSLKKWTLDKIALLQKKYSSAICNMHGPVWDCGLGFVSFFHILLLPFKFIQVFLKNFIRKMNFSKQLQIVDSVLMSSARKPSSESSFSSKSGVSEAFYFALLTEWIVVDALQSVEIGRRLTLYTTVSILLHILLYLQYFIYLS